MSSKSSLFIGLLTFLSFACGNSADNPLETISDTSSNVIINTETLKDKIPECEKYALSDNSIKGEKVKKNSTVKSEPNGQLFYEIQKDSLNVELSSEDFGDWYYMGFEVLPEYEIKTIDNGLVAKEVWHNDEVLITIFYLDAKKKTLPSWYDNDYISGYILKSSVYEESVPEIAFEKLKSEGKASLADYSVFLNQHHFSNFSELDEEGNCTQEFILFDSHVDGASAGTRMVLSFVNGSLVESTE